MKYQMVNEELQIASCSIADLTAKQAQQFTEQWGGDASLGTLTLFYDPSNELLVLNRDNKHYGKYKDIAECYLTADDNRRKEIRDKAPESIQETLLVLEKCVSDRTIYADIRKAKKNLISSHDMKVVNEMMRADKNCLQLAIMNAFCYGMMQGKRAERARRKH